MHNLWCLFIKWKFTTKSSILLLIDNVLGYSAESGSEGTSEGSDANSQSVSAMPLNFTIIDSLYLFDLGQRIPQEYLSSLCSIVALL